MKCFLGFIVLLFLFSCSTQIKQDNTSPGIDSIKIERDTMNTAILDQETSDEFICKGNEPFWQIKISSAENLIDFYEPMKNDTTHFDYVAPMKANSTGKRIYIAKNEKSTIQITLTKEKCSDGMSEKEYDYRAEVAIDKVVRKLSGCAICYNKPVN